MEALNYFIRSTTKKLDELRKQKYISRNIDWYFTMLFWIFIG